MNLIDLLRADGFMPFQKSPKEWASACAFCPDHGRDRLISFPLEGICGRYWCRRCGAVGTAYTYLTEYRRLTHKQACQALGVSAQDMNAFVPQQGRGTKAAKGFLDAGAESPPREWQNKAQQAVAASEKNLWSGSPKAVRMLEWLRAERGLHDNTIKAFHLGLVPRIVFRDRESWGLKKSEAADQ